MEWLNIVFTFIVDLVRYAAWPSVVLLILYCFREPISSLLKRVKKVGHKDTIVDFGDIPKAQKEKLEKGDIFTITSETIDYEGYLNFMESLAVVVGVLAEDLQRHHGTPAFLGIAKHILRMSVTKIKAERPKSSLLPFIKKWEEGINPSSGD